MTQQDLLTALAQTPEAVQFSEVMAVIDTDYTFTETAFTNGATQNAAGQNNGSCKIFAFAKLHGLSEAQTLACFGDYYRVDVLQNPEGEDHQNIRNFMVSGWVGIQFEGEVLRAKA